VSPALDSPYDIAEWKNHHWYRPQHIPAGLARWWSLSRAEKISLPDSDHAEARVFDVHSDHSIWPSQKKNQTVPNLPKNLFRRLQGYWQRRLLPPIEKSSASPRSPA